jgi:hypothetical protein
MINSLLSTLALQILGVLAAIGGLFAVFRAGKRSKAAEEKLKQSENYAKTRKQADEADIPSDDPAVLRDWLRERDPNTK